MVHKDGENEVDYEAGHDSHEKFHWELLGRGSAHFVKVLLTMPFAATKLDFARFIEHCCVHVPLEIDRLFWR